MSEERKWGVHDCPNGFYYLTDSVDGLYIGAWGYILDDDKDGILAICELLNEKESIIATLKEGNKRLKQQLLYKGDDVCSICKHEYLVPSGNYFIGKCKKEHKECSKKDIKYCEDFELIQADFEDLIKRMDKELIVND